MAYAWADRKRYFGCSTPDINEFEDHLDELDIAVSS